MCRHGGWNQLRAGHLTNGGVHSAGGVRVDTPLVQGDCMCGARHLQAVAEPLGPQVFLEGYGAHKGFAFTHLQVEGETPSVRDVITK